MLTTTQAAQRIEGDTKMKYGIDVLDHDDQILVRQLDAAQIVNQPTATYAIEHGDTVAIAAWKQELDDLMSNDTERYHRGFASPFIVAKQNAVRKVTE